MTERVIRAQQKKNNQEWEESQTPYGQSRLARENSGNIIDAGMVRVPRWRSELLEAGDELVVGLGLGK